jgi:VCBS repeat-containing protein
LITSGPEAASVAELADTTGSAAVDTTATVPAGTLNFSDADTGDTHTVAVSLGSEAWSGGSSIPAATQADLATALTTTLHDSTGTGTGGVDWNFGLADQDLDFLAAGETLSINYNIKVSDASTSSTQTVTVTVTGANDAPVITSGPEAATVAELPNTINSSTPDTASSTLAFSDPDLSDAHQVSVSLDSAVWSEDPSVVPLNTLTYLQTALTTALHDSTGHGTGSIDWTFSMADKDLDFLSPGQTLTATYDVTVSDGTASSTETVTVTMTGAADDAVVANPVTASIADTILQDAGEVVAAGNLIADGGDTGGDLSNVLSITDVNGHAVAGALSLAATYGTLTVFNDGTYVYVANSALDALLPEQNPTEQFNFTVSDSSGHSAATTLTFNVAGAADAQQITAADAFASVTEDAGPTQVINGGFETGDLTGWTGGATAQLLAIGGGFGNYAALLHNDGLTQDVATTPLQHYTLTFDVLGDPDLSGNTFIALWERRGRF